MNRRIMAFLPLILLAALALLLAERMNAPRLSGSIDSPLIGKALPGLGIDNLPKGPFILNFFASWCTPCLIEHPHLMQMKHDGITVIGIAFKDTQANIDKFLERHGNPYHAVTIDRGAALAMGITGVPESFAIDAKGIIRQRQQGPLEDADIISQFRKAVGQ